ncbi:MAG: hypothetical protein FRX49_12941 [Trebouxia sp. A1-2]|nr:MAG: hypothetical protein FRX49_12941 [Trebouxia sp. A1-2]
MAHLCSGYGFLEFKQSDDSAPGAPLVLSPDLDSILPYFSKSWRYIKAILELHFQKLCYQFKERFEALPMSQSTCFQLCDLVHPELQELMQGCSHVAESNEQTAKKYTLQQ